MPTPRPGDRRLFSSSIAAPPPGDEILQVISARSMQVTGYAGLRVPFAAQFRPVAAWVNSALDVVYWLQMT